MTVSRRWMLSIAGAAALGGCVWRRGVPPVAFGGQVTSPDESVMAALSRSGEHRIFTEMLLRSGVAETLSGNGPMTVIAPTDAAFAAARPVADIERMRADVGYLRLVIEGHVIRARVSSEEILGAIPKLGAITRVIAHNDLALAFLGDRPERLRWRDLRNRTGRITIRDAIAANGLIHLTDNVILPPADTAMTP